VKDDCFFDVSIETDSEGVSFPSDGKGDNRGYVDTNTAQKLASSDIQKLRDSGASGADIIKSLIANRCVIKFRNFCVVSRSTVDYTLDDLQYGAF
jgi:hypothetical protein